MLNKANQSRSLTIAFAVLMLLLVSAYVTGGLTGFFEAAGLNKFQEHYVFVAVAILASVAVLFGGHAGAIMTLGTIGSFIVLTVNQEPLLRYLTLAGLLFAIGMYGMVVSRNAVRVLMSIELMLNAVNINLVAFARYVDPLEVKGQLFAIFIITVAAAEAAVGLAIVLAIYRNTSTVDMERFNLLKW